jgi:uncharacterized repeat protein (TIGR01451 family)
MNLTQARTHRLHALPVALALIFNLFFGPVSPLLTSPVGALGASTFNATDGNLTDDGALETDWCTPAPNRVVGLDTPSGNNDNSFVSGPNKEDHDVPTVGAGSIPGNKDDLLRTYVASETVGTDLFVYLAWVRADPTGTSTIDFEFNQSDQVSSNGATKVRTDGDLLVSFDFQANPGSGGGYTVILVGRTWDSGALDNPDPTSSPPNRGAWVNPTPLILSGWAEGSVNFFGTDHDPIAISDCVSGGTIDNGEFGEAVLNLTDILGGDCKAFGSLFAKSRSSGSSFGSDLKDFILPIPVNLSTCSEITILKVDQFDNPVGGATFTITPNPFLANHTGFLDVLDNTGQQGYSGADDDATPGTIHLSDVEPYSANGGYEVCEKSAPSSDYVPDPNCITMPVGANSSVVFGPFVNEFLFPDLRIEKTPDEDAQNPGVNDVQAGDNASFTITLFNDGTGTANGATLEDDLPSMSNGWSIDSTDWADGCAIVGDHLSCGPEDIAADGSRSVTVSTETQAPEDCGDHDNPLATGDADNADPVTDSGNFDVLCGDLDVEKTPDGDDIFAGDTATFSIVTTNNGDGEARGSTLSDFLPAVANGWAIVPNPAAEPAWASCAITGDPQQLNCGPEDIAAGDSRVVTVSAETTIADCGTLSNPFAIVDSTNDGSDNDAGEIDVNCPDVSVEKTTDTPEINAGDDAHYTITVTAGGIGTSTNVTLTDQLPDVDGLWSQDNAACGIDGNDLLTCTFGDMEPGDSEVINLSHTTTANDCGTLTNQASVDSEVDLDQSNDLSDEVDIIVNCPDIVVEKTGSGTVNATDAIFFEITVSNTGDGDAYDFTFTDTLPTIAGTWTLTSFDNPPADCELNGLALSCTIPPDDIFAAGDSFTVRVDATTTFEDCGPLANAASASASNEADTDLLNNSDSHTITVQCPDLSAIKDADGDSPEIVDAGDPIGFTISVMNSNAAGTGTAYDVELNDPLPFGNGIDWSIDPTYAGPGTCEITGSPPAESLHCAFGDLAPGASASVHVVSDTTKQSCATYPNEASITATNHPELNPSDSVTVECPGLNIAKVATDDEIDAGETAEFTIIVWNTGPGNATDVTIHDELPGANLEWSESDDPSDSCEVVDNVLDCNFGDLGVTTMENSPARVSVAADTDRDDCGTLDNEAFANASNSDEISATASILVHCPTVEIVKENNQPDPVLPGTDVAFTLTVSVSDGPATDVVVVDTLPAGYDDPTDISDGGVWDGTSRTITWSLGTLDNGDKVVTYSAAVSLTAKQGDVLTNVAVVTSTNSQCPVGVPPAAECDDDSTTTVRVPTLVIDKAADVEQVLRTLDPQGKVVSIVPSSVHWTLTYTLTNGPVTNAVITDPIPAGLTYVDLSASDGGVYDSGTKTITWTFPSLTTSGFVTFDTTVNEDAPVGTITNVATIQSNETPLDDGQDSIRIVEEQQQGGTGTPAPSVPNTALNLPMTGGTVPALLFGLLLIGMLGGLAYANVVAVRRRR